jgi:murein tripeptide amidase MpaA
MQRVAHVQYLFIVWVALVAASLAGLSAAEDWQTPAEAAGFAATPSYAETMVFLHRLAAASPDVRLESFGRSAEGRELPLVIVSTDGAFTPEAARRAGRPVLLIQNGIHAGEIDGKDACLILLRDFVTGRRPGLFAGVTVLIVPIYNVDGHERVSPYNRPNQNGPKTGMGFRTTSAGLDLNRDHMKLATPEARALIALFNRWRPHLHVDNHVTDGSDHAWVLTWSWVEAPQIHPAIDAWFGQHLPPVMAAVDEAGYPTGPYVSLRDRSDPSQGFDSWVGAPRYSGGYFPLRNRPSILVEMHSYKPYEQRVKALVEFLSALSARSAAHGPALVAAVARAEAATVRLGEADASPSQVVLAWESEDTGDTRRWPVYHWTLQPSEALGVPILRFERGKVHGPDVSGIEVPWLHRGRPTKTTARPRGYLVLPGWGQIETALVGHGLRFERLASAMQLEAEVLRVEDAEFGPNPYQGEHRAQATVSRRVERVQVPAGALWVPADQPDFAVAVQLLEPEAPDSLFAWGRLSTVVERKEYIESAVLEDLVRAMLEEPAIAAEWAAALEDEELASDPSARWLWWYKRTPYWDPTVGRLPVLRVMHLPNNLKRP